MTIFKKLINKIFPHSTKQTICVFGDSITAGVDDTENGGWVALLQHYFDINEAKITVHNFGVSGNTTDDLLDRFEAECRGAKPDAIIFAIGINDTKYMGYDSDECFVPLKKFQDNLEKLTGQAKKIAERIIFVGLTPVDEVKTQPIFWDGEDSRIFFGNAKVDLYNSKIKEIAQENNLPFIEMLDLLDPSDLEDGLHPNSAGHEKMFLRIKDFLIKNKIAQ